MQNNHVAQKKVFPKIMRIKNANIDEQINHMSQ